MSGNGPFVTRRRVEFSDTDMGGVVHFSRYFVFMETAEHEFLRAHGVEVDTDVDGRRVSWPRVRTACQYRRPARFGDELAIEVRVTRRGTRSMSYSFRFLRDGEEIALGEAVAVCCRVDGPDDFEPIPIPEAIRARLPGSASEDDASARRDDGGRDDG